MEEIIFCNALSNPFTNYADLSPSLAMSKFPDFISSRLPSHMSCNREIIPNPLDPQSHIKIEKIAQDQRVISTCSKSGGSAELKVDISWGNKEDTKISIGASGEIHDNQGNYIKGEANRNNNGDSNVSISGGIKKESSSNHK